MEDTESLLAHLEWQLRARFPQMRVDPSSSSAHLVVRLRDEESSVVGVAIDNVGIPSFAVSYTRLEVTRKGDRKLSEVHAAGVLEPGLNWILQKVAQHGHVPPELD